MKYKVIKTTRFETIVDSTDARSAVEFVSNNMLLTSEISPIITYSAELFEVKND